MIRRDLWFSAFLLLLGGSAPASAIVCPSGFLEVTPGGGEGTLGCVEVSRSSAASWEAASQDCFDRVGGRLPTVEEWFAVWDNFVPPVDIGSSGPSEWTSDASLYVFSQTPILSFSTGVVAAEIESASAFTTSAVSPDGPLPYRCFIVPEPSASMMLPAGAGVMLALVRLRHAPQIE